MPARSDGVSARPHRLVHLKILLRFSGLFSLSRRIILQQDSSGRTRARDRPRAREKTRREGKGDVFKESQSHGSSTRLSRRGLPHTARAVSVDGVAAWHLRPAVLLTQACYQRHTGLFRPARNLRQPAIPVLFLPDPGLLAGCEIGIRDRRPACVIDKMTNDSTPFSDPITSYLFCNTSEVPAY
jgi:hypothetical protein